MAKRERYGVLVILTNNVALIWKEARRIAPDSAADKLVHIFINMFPRPPTSIMKTQAGQ